MGRPSKLTPEVQEEQMLLAVIQRAADAGDKDAAAWLRGEGYIGITHSEPRRSMFVKFDTQTERYTTEYAHWRRDVFERDNYTCRDCGQVGEKLNAHHIKSWSMYPELRFERSNGITLCEACHARRHGKAYAKESR